MRQTPETGELHGSDAILIEVFTRFHDFSRAIGGISATSSNTGSPDHVRGELLHERREVLVGQRSITGGSAATPKDGDGIMLTTRNALVAAGAAVLVALAGVRAASAADGNWVAYENGALPGDAIAAGHDTNGKTLYFCRAYLPPGFEPGKVNQNLGSCRYAYGRQEVPDPVYEVMVPHWEWGSGGQVPGAFPFQVSTDTDGARLYFCRAFYQGGLQIGKLKPGAGCYIGYGGNEILLNNYQALQADLPVTFGDAGRVPDIDNIPIIGGFEANQTTYLSLCVAFFIDGLPGVPGLPGKFLPTDGMCHSSYAGVEVVGGGLSMLLPNTVAIADANQPKIFNFPVGQDSNGQLLYACTARLLGADQGASLQLGKYRRDFDTCHVGYGGLEWNGDDSRLVDGF